MRQLRQDEVILPAGISLLEYLLIKQLPVFQAALEEKTNALLRDQKKDDHRASLTNAEHIAKRPREERALPSLPQRPRFANGLLLVKLLLLLQRTHWWEKAFGY